MSPTRSRLVAVGLAAAVLGAAAACSSQPSTQDPEPTSSVACPDASVTGEIKLSVSAPIEGFAPLLLAMQNGAFAEAGLDVTLERVPAADSLAVVSQGRLDGQLTSYGAGHLNAAASGVELKWVMPFYELPPIEADSTMPGYWASTDVVGTGATPDLSKLKGATIGSPTSGTGAGGMVMEKALRAQDLSLSDISFTQLSGADALTALENGSVAATWLSQPFDQEAAKNPKLRLIATYDPGINGSGLVVGPSLLDRPDVLVKFLMVIGETIEEHLQGNYRETDEVVEALATALNVDVEVLKGGTPLVFDPTLSMDDAAAYVAELETYLRAAGNLDYDDPIEADKIISTEYVDRAAACRAQQ